MLLYYAADRKAGSGNVCSGNAEDQENGIRSASVVKLVDTMDSKSIAFTGVAVRVRPLVPVIQLVTSRFI